MGFEWKLNLIRLRKSIREVCIWSPKDGLIWISNKQTNKQINTSFILFFFISLLSYRYLPEQVNSLGANINEKFHSFMNLFFRWWYHFYLNYSHRQEHYFIHICRIYNGRKLSHRRFTVNNNHLLNTRSFFYKKMNLVSLHGSMNVLSCGLWRHAHAKLTKKPAKIVIPVQK